MAAYTGGAAYPRATTGGGGWAIAEGILLVIVGIIAIAAPLATDVAIAVLLPIVLLINGIALIISAFRDRSFGGTVAGVLLGLLSIGAAILLFARPVIAVLTLPLLLAGYLFVHGLIQIVAGISFRAVAGWGWVLASGIINVILAAIILAQPPATALALTGIFIGASIFVSGVVLLLRGASMRGGGEPRPAM